MKLDKEKSKKFKFFESEKFKKIQTMKNKFINKKTILGVIVFSLSMPLMVSLTKEQTPQTRSVSALQLLEPYSWKGMIDRSLKYYEQVEQAKETFKEICAVYNLDFDKTYALAQSLTDNFQSEEYLTTKRIPGSTIQRQEPVFESRELGFLVFARALNQSPLEFDVSSKEIQSERIYEVTENPEQIVKKYSDIANLDPYLMLAIMDYESGYFQSNMCKTKNNPGGMRDSRRGGFKNFENLEQGIIENILLLKYHPSYQNKQSLERLTELASSYAPISDGGTNHLWVSNVTSIYHNLEQQDIFNEKTYTKK